jgi:arginine exporter protein ArgO
LAGVAWRLGRCRADGFRPASAIDKLGVVSVRIKRETLIAVCQLASISAAALILPCVLIDLAFDTDFLNILMQAALAGGALALIYAVWTDQEG